jgi:acyl carrier protein
MSTLEALQDILIKDYPLSRNQVTPDALLTTLGLDSLSVLELMFKIEDHFHLKIVDDSPINFVTVNDVAHYIDGLLEAKDAGEARLNPN